jgi:NAD(P)H-dependent flavin oxidoreductase YrpB (nitropropane dioxygenase family)
VEDPTESPRAPDAHLSRARDRAPDLLGRLRRLCGAELVQAVSGAGGCGVLGGSGLPPDEIRRRIDRVRELTDRPFGVNFIIAALEDPDSPDEDRAFIAEQVDAAVQARVSLIVLFWGPAAPFVEDAHRNGVKVLIQVGSVEEAEAAAAAGVDAVIVQGIEAGGHVRGTTSIWKLLPETVEAVEPVAVLASGGIGDGEGLARALQLGAQGASLGTRFVASEEGVDPPRLQATHRREQRRGHLLRDALRRRVAGCSAPDLAVEDVRGMGRRRPPTRGPAAG